jgi:2-oxo-4-hydroxy-4-carboxy-5-ureidoimidazoline decarboxylase
MIRRARSRSGAVPDAAGRSSCTGASARRPPPGRPAVHVMVASPVPGRRNRAAAPIVGAMPEQRDVLAVPAFDALDAGPAAAVLAPCCASRRWADLLVAGRPYRRQDALIAASDAAISVLTWDDISEALAAHPRIGGSLAAAGREAAWSAQEQRSAATAGAAERDELAAANAEYEERFGYVFLIRASGRSAADMLAALRERLGHDPAAEREVVRDELRGIVALRLARVLR